MKYLLIILFLFFSYCKALSQQADPAINLPLNVYPSPNDTSKPLVIYISGDGGFNNFSKKFIEQFQQQGFPVVMLNSLKYFWTKKTAEQTATDMESIFRFYLQQWNRNSAILIGYSFGADVLPFIFNRLQKTWSDKVNSLVFVSLSHRTDFEVHINELLGAHKKTGISTVEEINKINTVPLLIIYASDETDVIAAKEFVIKNYKKIILRGGHHYENNSNEVAKIILQSINTR